MKSILVAVALLGALGTANAEDLYWRIVDPHGKLLSNASTDTTDVSALETDLQASYPGIKLSIKNCRQPTLVESMDPVYGRSWQCGTIVYRGTIVRPPPQLPAPAVKFPPTKWNYFAHDGNDVLFVSERHQTAEGTFIWTEGYNGFALAEEISRHLGITVINMTFDSAPPAVQRAAEDIVNSNPSSIGGPTYRETGQPQKDLYEINCATKQMRSVQTIGPDGKVLNDLAFGTRWFSPMAGTDARWTLVRDICAS